MVPDMNAKHTTMSMLAMAGALMTGLTAHAQQSPAASPPMASDAATPQQERAALNGAEAQAAAQQLSQDEVNQRQHDAEMARWQNEQAEYRHASREHRAETAEYRAAMVRWHEDVIACQAGDRTRCVPEPQP